MGIQRRACTSLVVGWCVDTQRHAFTKQQQQQNDRYKMQALLLSASSSVGVVVNASSSSSARGRRPNRSPPLRNNTNNRRRGGRTVVNMLPPGGMPNMPGMDPEKMKEMQAAYQEAMKNPESAKKIQEQMKQMQGMMSNPMVQQQMQAMQNMVQNEDMQKRIAGLKDDPEFKDFFDDLRTNGPGAMMKPFEQRREGRFQRMLFHPEAQHLHQQHQHLRLKLKRYMMPHDTVISRLSKISSPLAKMSTRETLRKERHFTTPLRSEKAPLVKRFSIYSLVRILLI